MKIASRKWKASLQYLRDRKNTKTQEQTGKGTKRDPGREGDGDPTMTVLQIT